MVYVNNIFDNESCYKRLFELIPEGEENAVSMSFLARTLCIECRDVRALILNARKDGYIVASNTNGYFIPSDSQELLRYYRRTQQRQKSTAISLIAVRKKLMEDGEYEEA